MLGRSLAGIARKAMPALEALAAEVGDFDWVAGSLSQQWSLGGRKELLLEQVEGIAPLLTPAAVVRSAALAMLEGT